MGWSIGAFTKLQIFNMDILWIRDCLRRTMNISRLSESEILSWELFRPIIEVMSRRII